MNIKIKEKFVSSLVTLDNEPIEMIFDPESGSTEFVGLIDCEIRHYPNYFVDPRDATLVPYPASHGFVAKKLVLFPSKATGYENEMELVAEIRSFIHKYLDVSEFFEKIASFYVLFSWIYDCFNELPYLRAIGDYGSGKSRFLQTIGSVCYKPIFASGATTVSPIFRLIDEIGGTLILDEADFTLSDTYSEIVKILNSGHSKGMPVIRSESNNNSFEPKTFNVYCPKIIATRNFYKDKALESRFIVEEMGQLKLRNDIPINLPDEFFNEALNIRNKLLMFRLRNYGKVKIDPSLVDRNLEPRLNQIIVPLMSIIKDSDIREELKKSVSDYHVQMTNDRGMEFDGQILEIINKLISTGIEEPTIGQIKDLLIETYGEDFEKKPTARGIGSRIRQSFKLRTTKTREGYIIPLGEKPKLDRYFQRYGVVNNENIVNIEQENAGIKVEDMSTEEIQAVFDG